MQKNSRGCRVVISNHFHLLLEVPPKPLEGIAGDELLRRLGAVYTETAVADVAKEWADSRMAGNQSKG